MSLFRFAVLVLATVVASNCLEPDICDLDLLKPFVEDVEWNIKYRQQVVASTFEDMYKIAKKKIEFKEAKVQLSINELIKSTELRGGDDVPFCSTTFNNVSAIAYTAIQKINTFYNYNIQKSEKIVDNTVQKLREYKNKGDVCLSEVEHEITEIEIEALENINGILGISLNTHTRQLFEDLNNVMTNIRTCVVRGVARKINKQIKN